MHVVWKGKPGDVREPIALVTGMSSYLGILYVVFFSKALSAFGRFQVNGGYLWLLSVVFSIICFVTMAVLNQRAMGVLCSRRAQTVAAGIMVLGYALMVLGSSLTSGAVDLPYVLTIAGAIIASILHSFFYVVWALVFGNHRSKTGNEDVMVAVSFFIAMAFSFALSVIPGPVAAIIAVLLPVVMVTCLRMFTFDVSGETPDNLGGTISGLEGSGEIEGPGRIEGSGEIGGFGRFRLSRPHGFDAPGRSVWLNMLAGLFVFWVCFVSVEMLTAESSGGAEGWPFPVSPSVLALLCALPTSFVFMGVMLWFARQVTYDLSMRVAAPLLASSLALFPVFAGQLQSIVYTFAFTAMTIMNVTVWVATVRVIRKGTNYPVFAATGPRTAIYLGIIVTHGIWPLLASAPATLLTAILLIALAVSSSITLPRLAFERGKSESSMDRGTQDAYGRPYRMHAEFGPSPVRDSSAEPGEYNREYLDSEGDYDELLGGDDVCAEMARLHGMTEREAEVLALLAHGRNAAYIKERLFISRNTVNSHIGHVYHKLGVHSRQELIDMFEEWRERRGDPAGSTKA